MEEIKGTKNKNRFTFQHVANTMQIADCCARMLQIPCNLRDFSQISVYTSYAHGHSIVQMAPRCCESSAKNGMGGRIMRSDVKVV